jgi:hypothetical protein
VSVKQDTPQAILAGSLSFAQTGGVSTMAPLFDPALLGLESLSDVQTLSPVNAFMAQPAADNLLILSLDSRRLVEVDRSGAILSSFDLSTVTAQAIEGITVDEHGTLYLVAEDSGFGNSRLFVLTPVPEPETYTMMLLGLGLLAGKLRGRIRRARSAQQTSQRLEFGLFLASNVPPYRSMSFFETGSPSPKPPDSQLRVEVGRSSSKRWGNTSEGIPITSSEIRILIGLPGTNSTSMLASDGEYLHALSIRFPTLA